VSIGAKSYTVILEYVEREQAAMKEELSPAKASAYSGQRFALQRSLVWSLSYKRLERPRVEYLENIETSEEE
jgi:hypothetical protein